MPFFSAANRCLALGLLIGLAAQGEVAWAQGVPPKAKFNLVLRVGDPAPDWKHLPGTDGQSHALQDFAATPVLVVLFTCNHCPCAEAYEDRVKALATQFPPGKVQLVAICCSRKKNDQLPAMQRRAQERRYPYLYLHDGTQQVGRAYGATATPQVFVLNRDRRVVYMGAIDDQNDPQKVERSFARSAILAVLEGKLPEVTETRPRGCGIDYP